MTAITSAIAASPTRLSSRSPSMPARRRTVQAALAAAAATLLAATGAAAATGSLPDAAQSAVSRALSHVSVDVPNPDHPTPGAAEAGDQAASPVGPDATGPAKHGLCTAWAARNRTDGDRGHSGDSVAFSNLRQAAQDQDMLVRDYCADEIGDGATTTTTTSEPAAAPDSADEPGRSGADHGKSGQDHGPVADDPAGEQPDTSTTTGAEAPGTEGSGHGAPGSSSGHGKGSQDQP